MNSFVNIYYTGGPNFSMVSVTSCKCSITELALTLNIRASLADKTLKIRNTTLLVCNISASLNKCNLDTCKLAIARKKRYVPGTTAKFH